MDCKDLGSFLHFQTGGLCLASFSERTKKDLFGKHSVRENLESEGRERSCQTSFSSFVFGMKHSKNDAKQALVSINIRLIKSQII